MSNQSQLTGVEDTTAPITNQDLSARDKSVLDRLFDPEGNYSAPDEGANTAGQTAYSAIQPERLEQLRKLELEAIEKAESGSEEGYKESIAKLTDVIELCPEYASAYNNRAQAYRMSGDTKSALADLDKAIEFGHTGNDKQALKQAYTQRGLLRKTLASPDDESASEAALADLERGAKYGNDLAKKIAAAENPYAKMCAAMVKEMLAHPE